MKFHNVWYKQYTKTEHTFLLKQKCTPLVSFIHLCGKFILSSFAFFVNCFWKFCLFRRQKKAPKCFAPGRANCNSEIAPAARWNLPLSASGEIVRFAHGEIKSVPSPAQSADFTTKWFHRPLGRFIPSARTDLVERTRKSTPNHRKNA